MRNHTPRQRRIVGVDGHAPGRAALRWAAARTHPDDGPLVLAHVAASEHEHGLSDAVLAESAELVHREYPGVTVETLPLLGSVAEALASTAADRDLIVIGTHKTGLAHGRVTGSMSVQLAMAATGAVAVVPDIDLRFRRGVVAGIGRLGTAARVAAIAYAEARRADVPLTLVHGGCTARCSEALDAAGQGVDDPHGAVTVRRRALATPATDALLDAALDKELLVLGPGTRGAERTPIGAITHAVLMNINVPVLLIGSEKSTGPWSLFPISAAS